MPTSHLTLGRLSSAVRCLNNRSHYKRLRQNSAKLLPTEPAAFGRYFEGEVERWAKLVQEGKLERLN